MNLINRVEDCRIIRKKIFMIHFWNLNHKINTH